VADSGKSGVKDIYIVGFNGDEIALQAIKAGQLGATIQQVPKEMGKMTVDLASTLMKGDKVKYSNPANREVYVPVKLITAADVSGLLK
jgi:ribose transport system substrate-binding protein